MRLNRFIALATGMSRRDADKHIQQSHVQVDGQIATVVTSISADSLITLNGKRLAQQQRTTIMLNKPVGYVCSRDGQGSKTIYDLLPPEQHNLKPIGRLDKDSSGLLLLTNDGELAHQLTHPSFQKEKIYEIELDKELSPLDKKTTERGVELEDGVSKLQLQGLGKNWIITMHEGRNRQIRRTFKALGYDVAKLHRTQFGDYRLGSLPPGKTRL